MTESHEDVVAHAKQGREEKRGVFSRLSLFVREVVAELRKVVTPTRRELVNYTTVVLIFVIIMMALVSGLDFVIGLLTGFVFGDGTFNWGN
ncbi:MAG: preprotein translocase subunit SecE [Actinomycetota bacterium]|jgi:preprotein translocase subunit SecE